MNIEQLQSRIKCEILNTGKTPEFIELNDVEFTAVNEEFKRIAGAERSFIFDCEPVELISIRICGVNVRLSQK